MKTFVLLFVLLIPMLGYSQEPEQPEEYVNRLWLTADTAQLNRSYAESKLPIIDTPEPTRFKQELILQDNEFRFRWDMETLRLLFIPPVNTQYRYIYR